MTRKEYLERTIDFDDAIARIIRLEKENADLKEQNEILSKHILELQADKGRLTDENRQAKEIIKYLLSFIQKENYRTRWDINIAKAEAFLKE